MGFFSWMTKDTNKSISNKSSNRGTFTVWMHTPDGKHYQEKNYNGYGLFGGEDYYVQLAKANPSLCPNADPEREDDLRNAGIDISFEVGSGIEIRYPILTESDTYSGDFLNECEGCEAQGFFYDDSDDDEDDEDEVIVVSEKGKKRQRAAEDDLDDQEPRRFTCKGRTGPNPSAAQARVTVREDGTLFIRVDDVNNLEFWLELTIPKSI
jgi:hypothetical protein